MTLDEIFELWAADSNVDRTDLGNVAISLAKLHHKYYRIFSQERLLLKRLEAEKSRLKLDKTEFYVDGPTQEQIELGWKLPAKGRVMKTDLPLYLEGDEDLIKINLKIAYQREKIDLLESIIKTLHGMGFQIKTAVEFEKFKVGA